MSAAALPFSFCAVMSTITPCHVIGLGANLFLMLRSDPAVPDRRPGGTRWRPGGRRPATSACSIPSDHAVRSVHRVREGGKPVGTEESRCAPGPVGWRYFSQVEATDPSPHHETLDFAVAADWSIARVRIATGEHDILWNRAPTAPR